MLETQQGMAANARPCGVATGAAALRGDAERLDRFRAAARSASPRGDEAKTCLEILADLLHAAWPLEADFRAAQLIDQFGSLPKALAADPAALRRCLGRGGEAIAAFLSSVRGAQIHSLRREIEDAPLFPTSAALLDYLHVRMAWSTDEEFRVLYLDARNRLLRDERIASGTPDEVTVHPRMIMKRALELGATALVLVHNHPSGLPDPSQSDIQTTARIVRAARTLDIAVHDHVIVARSGSRSFRRSGLLV